MLVLLFALMMFVSHGTAYALTNGGFESSTTGWGSNDFTKALVVTSHTSDLSTTYTPQEGSHFLELWAGLGTGVYTKASQSFTVSDGQWVQGWAAFDARDASTNNDSAYVKVSNAADELVWLRTVSNVGSYGDGPWEQWASDPLTAGFYTLEFGVANKKNNLNSSVALFDGAAVAPEPVSMLLVGIGLAGLPFVRRTRRRFRGFAGKLS